MILAIHDLQTWGSVSDIITAFAALVGIAGLYFLYHQIRLAKSDLALAVKALETATESLRTEFERYKRTNAFAATAAYVNWGPPSLYFARKLAEGLDAATCKKIEDGDACNIPAKLKKEAGGCLSSIANNQDWEASRVITVGNDQFVALNEKEVIHIRSLIVSHLSQLEIALMSWHHNDADEGIIMGQFKDFICPLDATRKPMLATYRDATGGDIYYPALTHFIKVVEERRKASPPGASPTQPRLPKLGHP